MVEDVVVVDVDGDLDNNANLDNDDFMPMNVDQLKDDDDDTENLADDNNLSVVIIVPADSTWKHLWFMIKMMNQLLERRN
ncbi:unnamed protein product [Linum trigynum]|uniref:Uncharacterized protein n=1 Tax=Linum trigynum TaxID=586398 RepID=A0AAV2EX81_9ROSI